MSGTSKRLTIQHIHIGFKDVIMNQNYVDCHQQLKPFGIKWGRGILIKGERYLEAITGPYGISHSKLKEEMVEKEQSAGAFYYGYTSENKTLYLEYASDTTFNLRDKDVINAIMNSLKVENGPLRNFKIDED